jgi:hypothetical protein
VRILNLREEHRFRVYEERILERILGPKGKEVTRDIKKNCTLINLWRTIWAHTEWMTNTYSNILALKPQ